MAPPGQAATSSMPRVTEGGGCRSMARAKVIAGSRSDLGDDADDGGAGGEQELAKVGEAQVQRDAEHHEGEHEVEGDEAAGVEAEAGRVELGGGEGEGGEEAGQARQYTCAGVREVGRRRSS
jgi:hypothetical protein